LHLFGNAKKVRNQKDEYQKGNRPGAQGRMPPGGDPAFLIFWFFFIKKKERTKK